jgi:hypothetical protein
VRATVALTRLIDQAFGRMPAADKPAEADDEETPWDAMTPTQRAKARAQIATMLADLDAEEAAAAADHVEEAEVSAELPSRPTRGSCGGCPTIQPAGAGHRSAASIAAAELLELRRDPPS